MSKSNSRAKGEKRELRQVVKDLQGRCASYKQLNDQLQGEIDNYRKRAEELEFIGRILKISNQETEKISFLEELVTAIQEFTGCEAVGIRLLDEKGGIPYEAYSGFSKEFYESESPLSVENDKCMCINVIRGDTDSKLRFYTEFGSFFMNGTTKFLATVSEDQKGQTRNKCNEEGYESVAIVPIRRQERILGLIHIADKHEKKVPLELVKVLEKTGMLIGPVIQRIRAEEELRDSEGRSRAWFEHSPVCTKIVDLDLNLQFMSASGIKDLKIDDITQFYGKPYPFRFYPEPFRNTMTKSLEKVKETGQVITQETCVVDIDGNELWYHSTLVPVNDDLGRVEYIMVVSIEITDRKRAEELVQLSLKEKELLLKEVHHRTKNNFQVISSILYLQSEYFNDDKVSDILEKCQNRIKSMAAVHEQLYKSKDISSIDFEEYTYKLLASLCHFSGMPEKQVSFEINIDSVFLGLDLAVPCGLIINELFSNSLKHAFPELNKGGNKNAQICIDMHETDGQGYTLVVSDNGTGFAGDIESMKGKSLGLFLVKNLTEQLEGTVELDTDKGTKFTIKFPSNVK